MNQRTVLGIILVFALSMLSQCTVQKRLYRKGFYISFNHRHKQGATEKEEKSFAVVSRKDSSETAPYLLENNNPASVTDTPVLTDLPVAVEKTNTEMKTVEVVINQTKKMFGKQREITIKPSRFFKQKAKEEIDSSVGFFMVLGGVVLLLGGLLLAILAAVLGELILPYIGGLMACAGLLLIVFGLILGFSGNSPEETEKKKAKIKEKKSQQQKLSEEEWTELKQKQYQKAVRTTILLVVLFFGISLFAIAVGEPMPLIVITGAMFLIFLAFVWGTYKAKRKEDPVLNTES